MRDETMIDGRSIDDARDPAAWPVFYWGLIGTLVVIVSVLALEVFFEKTAGTEAASKASSVVRERLEQSLADQGAALEEYRWVDEENGVVAIPIERAMELVVEEAQGSR